MILYVYYVIVFRVWVRALIKRISDNWSSARQERNGEVDPAGDVGQSFGRSQSGQGFAHRRQVGQVRLRDFASKTHLERQSPCVSPLSRLISLKTSNGGRIYCYETDERVTDDDKKFKDVTSKRIRSFAVKQ